MGVPKATGFVLAAGLVAGAVGADRAEAGVFYPETFTLENGLQVVVVTNERAPVVIHQLWYKVGAADEPPGKSGIAHFLEHLMFKGTTNMPAGGFSALIAENGGEENAFTSWDFTGYHQSIASDRLGLMMKWEADRMTNLILSDDQVDPERKVILEERRSRTDSQPNAQLREAVTATLFQNHPYGVPIIGWEHEMRGLTTEDAFSFYHTWYAPNNAVLILSGDVSVEEARALATEHYGPIPARPAPERVRPTEPPHLTNREVRYEHPRVRQPSWRRTRLAPSARTGAVEEVHALQVLATILGGGGASRLYTDLVIEQGVATGAGAFYVSDRYDHATFTIYAAPKPDLAGGDPEEQLERLEQAIDAVIAKLLKDDVTEDEVARAKTRMIDQAAFARDGLSGAARMLGSALASGQTIDDVELWPERIAAVTPEAVNAAARALLGRPGAVTGLLLPKPTS